VTIYGQALQRSPARAEAKACGDRDRGRGRLLAGHLPAEMVPARVLEPRPAWRRSSRKPSNSEADQHSTEPSLPAACASAVRCPGICRRGCKRSSTAQSAGRRRPSHRHRRWRRLEHNRAGASQQTENHELFHLPRAGSLSAYLTLHPIAVSALPSCASYPGAGPRRWIRRVGRIHMLNGDRSWKSLALCATVGRRYFDFLFWSGSACVSALPSGCATTN